MKRKVFALLATIMIVAMLTACGGAKGSESEKQDTATTEDEKEDEASDKEESEEKEEESTSQKPEVSTAETEKTEWGNDEYGYITLSSDWHNFITSDLSAEANANMLQWQSNDMSKIVTLTAGSNSPEEIIQNVVASEEPGTYTTDFAGEEGDDIKLGLFTKYYEDEDIVLVIFTFKTDYSDRTYYVAI